MNRIALRFLAVTDTGFRALAYDSTCNFLAGRASLRCGEDELRLVHVAIDEDRHEVAALLFARYAIDPTTGLRRADQFADEGEWQPTRAEELALFACLLEELDGVPPAIGLGRQAR